MSDHDPQPQLRERVPPAPRGARTLRWLGPGLLWMMSSVGSGSVLFTPRIGARYQYELLWLALLVCFLMWVMIREAGRYTVVSGETLLQGLSRLPGPRNWAVWLVFLPQLVAAVAGVAGLAALVGSAFKVAVGGSHAAWGVGTVVATAALVVAGQYQKVERAAQVLAGVLIAVAVVAAVKVFPGFSRLGAGLVPGLPQTLDLYFIVPWVGTILAGSMGILWYSYWAATRGYGGGVAGLSDEEPVGQREGGRDGEGRDVRLTRWLRVMSLTALLGVVTGAAVIVAFLVLGSELLAPKGIVPQGIDVARDLSRLLSEVWGRFGYWLMIVAVVIALGGSIFANQDGWGRSFADMTRILVPGERLRRLSAGLPVDLAKRRALKNVFVLTLTGLLPVLVIVLVRDPVRIMSASGIVAAAHTPVIVGLTLALNRRRLPARFRPGWWFSALMLFSTLFYAGFGALQLLSLMGISIAGGGQGAAG